MTILITAIRFSPKLLSKLCFIRTPFSLSFFGKGIPEPPGTPTLVYYNEANVPGAPRHSSFRFLFFFCKKKRKRGARGAEPLAKNQPLTAPMVMPWVKYFWNRRKMAMMGMAAKVAPAIRMPTSMDVSAWRVAMPREMV